MISAVLDANVLASGFVGYEIETSTPGELMRRWRNGGFELVTSPPILQEFTDTLAKPYFARDYPPSDGLRTWRFFGEKRGSSR